MKTLKASKGNIVYTALFLITFILAFLVMRNIPLFGDDYYYVTFQDGNFWKMHKEHYMLANGRAVVHFLVTVFISIPPVFWQALNSAFLALIALMAAKQFNFGRAGCAACICALAMILSLHVDIVRESVYWLTGSFNYVYPFALLMVFWYLLCKSKNMVALYILAFFSAATTEQNGMMTLGIVVLYLIDAKFIRNEKLSKGYIFLLIPAAIGFVSVYFAPATFVRYGIETEKSMIEVIKEQLPLLYYNFIAKKYMFPFIVFTLASMGLYLFKCPSIFTKIVSVFNVFQIALAFYISKTPYAYAGRKVLLALFVFSAIFLVNIILIFIKLIKGREREYFIICTAFILAVGSQLMMSASPVSGSRTMLCGIFNLVIFDIGLICAVCEDKRYFALSLVLSVLFLLFGARIYANTYIGYKTNYPVTAENEALIDEYKLNPTGSLTQYTLPYPDHCWSMPYQSTYHLYYYKLYYHLHPDTKIDWIEFR